MHRSTSLSCSFILLYVYQECLSKLNDDDDDDDDDDGDDDDDDDIEKITTFGGFLNKCEKTLKSEGSSEQFYKSPSQFYFLISKYKVTFYFVRQMFLNFSLNSFCIQ